MTIAAAVAAEVRAYQRAVDAFDEAAAAALGVNRTDLRCLDVLLERGSASPGELAAALGLTTGSVTAMLDRLERMGYLSRTSDPADRRRVQVRPAAAATRAADRLWGPLATAARDLM
ncbi:MAG: MarR family transcriptional regulator, partial [Gemmatimonadales bacterium]